MEEDATGREDVEVEAAGVPPRGEFEMGGGGRVERDITALFGRGKGQRELAGKERGGGTKRTFGNCRALLGLTSSFGLLPRGCRPLGNQEKRFRLRRELGIDSLRVEGQWKEGRGEMGS